MMNVRNMPAVLAVVIAVTVPAAISFGHVHTHIGRNQDQVWGNADDNKLWFFAVPGAPGWPDWGEPFELVLQDSGLLAGKYVCQEFYCWHSGHPPHGDWQLGGKDPGVEPEWRIGVQRVSFDPGFQALDYVTNAPVLVADGEICPLSPREFMADKHNEDGDLGAWGIHYHQRFIAEAGGPGEVFEATFRAVDLGAVGFLPSEDYTVSFVTVPEPGGMALFALAGAALLRRRRKR